VGTKHLAMCDMRVDDDKFEIYNWFVQSCLPTDINVNTTSINDIVPHFASFASSRIKSWTRDSRGDLLPIDMVYIENQPMGLRGAARNLKTKVLSHVLQSLLIIDNPSLKILFINPSLKLKEMPRDGKSTYAANKKFAVLKTSEYICGPQCSGNVDCFQREKKKDDLADAFLQGLYAGRLKIVQDAPIVEKKVSKKRKLKAIVINE
jgi:hypothetical protein